MPLTGAGFDWEINAGNALFNLALAAIVGWFVKRSTAVQEFIEVLKLLKQQLQDFPPHRHKGAEIIYPKGAKPENGS